MRIANMACILIADGRKRSPSATKATPGFGTSIR